MAGIYSQGGSAGHRYAGWLSEVEAKNFQFGGKVFNGSPSAIYVGSNLVWSYWLKHATWEAILGAFGQRDGWAVIKATNAYLNQLAASDRDKATALAGFINEDPMMVCSLGLQVEGVTMPIRWLVGDGTAYIDTGYVIASTDVIKAICKRNGANWVGGVRQGNGDTNSVQLCFEPTACRCSFAYNSGATYAYAIQDPNDTIYVELKKNSCKLNGVSQTMGESGSSMPTYPFALFALGQGNFVAQSATMLGKFEVEGVMELVPFKSQTEGNVLLDLTKVGIEGATLFYYNANSSGSFTIPDISYTPSTP